MPAHNGHGVTRDSMQVPNEDASMAEGSDRDMDMESQRLLPTALASSTATATGSDATPITTSGTACSSGRGVFSSLQQQLSKLATFTWHSGVICSLIAAAVFAFNSLMIKLLRDRVPTTEIILYRSAMSLAMCAYWVHVARLPQFFGEFRNMHLLLSRGTFGAASMQCLYLSLFMLPLADAVTLFFLNPAVTTIAAFFILKEHVGLVGTFGVAVSLGGLLVLTQPPFIFGHGDAWDQQRTQGTIFGIMSALLGSGAFISIRLIGDREASITVSVWFHSVALVSTIIPLCISYPEPAVWPTAVENVILVVVGVTSFIGQLTLSRGFQLQTAARASAINLTQVVWSYVLGMSFLHEALSWMGAAGSLLIGAGAVMVNLKPKPRGLPNPNAPSEQMGDNEAQELLPLRALPLGDFQKDEGGERVKAGQKAGEGAMGVAVAADVVRIPVLLNGRARSGGLQDKSLGLILREVVSEGGAGPYGHVLSSGDRLSNSSAPADTPGVGAQSCEGEAQMQGIQGLAVTGKDERAGGCGRTTGKDERAVAEGQAGIEADADASAGSIRGLEAAWSQGSDGHAGSRCMVNGGSPACGLAIRDGRADGGGMALEQRKLEGQMEAPAAKKAQGTSLLQVFGAADGRLPDHEGRQTSSSNAAGPAGVTVAGAQLGPSMAGQGVKAREATQLEQHLAAAATSQGEVAEQTHW